jgi:hypothetical protein
VTQPRKTSIFRVPAATVDNYHPAARPLRLPGEIAAPAVFAESLADLLSPSQPDHQTERLIHVCFLVACPEAFWASAISASSISILMRIGDPSRAYDRNIAIHYLAATAGTE